MVVLEEIGSDQWTIIESPCVEAYMNSFNAAVEVLEEENLALAEKMIREIIAACPDHIDAIHHLAIIAAMQGRSLEHFLLEKEAVEVGLKNASPKFDLNRSTLEWSWLKNRPFLRAYHGLALAYLKRGSTRQAADRFSNLLSLNPRDNQGTRCEAIWCFFELAMPEQVLSICEHFPDDTLPETLYGRALAHIKLGQISESRSCLTKCVEWLPSIARELIKVRHTVPKQQSQKYIVHGSNEQACEYWKRFGKYWESSNEALSILKEFTRQKLGNENLSEY